MTTEEGKPHSHTAIKLLDKLLPLLDKDCHYRDLFVLFFIFLHGVHEVPKLTHSDLFCIQVGEF